MQDVLQLRVIEKQHVMVLEDAFAFRKDLGWQWLQRLCIFALRKIGAHHNEMTCSTHAVQFAPAEFMERLLERRYNLVERYGRDIDRLLIGSEDFDEMMRTQSHMTRFEFSTSFARDRSVMGMRVEVIPWMRGMLLLPKER